MCAHAAGDRGRAGLVGPLHGRDDRLVELQLLQLPALGVRGHPRRADQPAAAHPVHGGRQLRQQAPDHAGRRDRGGALEGHRTAGALPGGPVRQHRRQRQRRPRPLLRRRARLLRRGRDAQPHAEDHRRLRRLLPVRPRPARQRDGPADRAVPHRQPALRRRLRADEQGAAGLLPRRGRRPRQLHPGTAGRRGRRGARHRRRRAAAAQLHPARRVPVQDPDGQHLRQRQLRGRARPGTGDRRPASTGRPSRNGCAPRGATSASAWPAARSAPATTPASGGSSTTTRRCPPPAPRRA